MLSRSATSALVWSECRPLRLPFPPRRTHLASTISVQEAENLHMKFLKENWIWIVAPVVTVLVVLAVLFYFTDQGPVDDFTYPLN